MSKPYQYIIKFNEPLKLKIDYFDKSNQQNRITKVNEFAKDCSNVYSYFENYFNFSPKAKTGPLSEDYEICRILS